MVSSSSSSSSEKGSRMPRATFRTRIDAASRSGGGFLTVEAGDVLLRATCTNDTILNGFSLEGLSVGIEKPGCFVVDYDLGARAPSFQFMNVAKVGSKPLSIAYSHRQSDQSSTSIEAGLALDARNKVACNYEFASQSGKIKYSYMHDDGTLLEPSYHLGNKAWDFSASRNITSNDSIKGTYKGLEKSVSVDWTRGGSHPFKIYADIPLGNTSKPPKLMMEKIWSC